jgi:hypothetical protein
MQASGRNAGNEYSKDDVIFELVTDVIIPNLSFE